MGIFLMQLPGWFSLGRKKKNNLAIIRCWSVHLIESIGNPWEITEGGKCLGGGRSET